MDTIEKNSILLADNLKVAKALIQSGSMPVTQVETVYPTKPAPCTDCAGATSTDPTTQEDPALKNDTYFPIVVNLPGTGGTGAGTTTNQEGQITEDEKRKRAIIASAIVLALLVLILVAMAFFSKSNK